MMVIYTVHTQGPRFVESHICQNRADIGAPVIGYGTSREKCGLAQND
jgi:hypothetical protein